MNESGLFLDLKRIDEESRDRALQGNSWERDCVYICDRNHRMHTVCSTLEALGYVVRRYDWRNPEHAESAWALTDRGRDLFDDLRRARRRL